MGQYKIICMMYFYTGVCSTFFKQIQQYLVKKGVFKENF